MSGQAPDPTVSQPAGSPPQYTIVLAPGHGGAPSTQKEDKWDPRTRSYLGRYLYGDIYKNIHEHRLVLPLSMELQRLLTLTESAAGWQEFEKILSQFSTQQKFPRIVLKSHLTRTDSYDDHNFSKQDDRNHAAWRLYDYPDARTGRMQPGRLSRINALKPWLVVAIHTTPAGRSQPGGMGVVLAPGYQTFNTLRLISLGQKSIQSFYRMPWADKFLITDRGWSQYEGARSDAWVYFHGWKTRGGRSLRRWPEMNRGLRQNMLTWRYADPPGWEKLALRNEAGPYSTVHKNFRATGPFWDRERGQAEAWRREGGPLGYGGDNYYASDQLLRYVQYGARLQSSQLRRKGALNGIIKPFVSAYTLPTYVNAINAYLEIAHTNRSKDRQLLEKKYYQQTARSLAVGIYALFQQISLKPGYGPWRPRAAALDFKKYADLPGGNYFEQVVK
ncbi:MAG: N-acetylmuramoyl-L-alanine amidase [Leptospiraceae bacterium]|nr:N-acetylmuramoyl-L-alanine amidase [Leptospiraceae bacterium]